MSIATTVERREAGSGVLARLVAAMKRLLAAYLTRRLEQCAIAVLRSLSDRELQDLGLSRSDIPSAVRRRGAHDRAFTAEY